MFLVDLNEGRIVDDDEIKASLANALDYEELLESGQVSLDDIPVRPMLVPSATTS
jgi:hypothetical protein